MLSFLSLQMADQNSYAKDNVCRICTAEFRQRSKLFEHLLQAHGIGKLFKCKECAFETRRWGDLKRHNDVHRGGLNQPSTSRSRPRPRARSQSRSRSRSRSRSPLRCRSVVMKLPNNTTDTEPRDETVPVASPAISLHTSPFLNQSPTRPVTGKPLSMLLQSLSNTSDSSDSDDDGSDNENDTRDFGIPPTPDISPASDTPPDVARENKYIPKEVQMSTTTNAIPPGKILASMQERKTIKYHYNGRVIRQTDVTEIYPVLLPASWDKRVECHHGLKTNPK